MNNTVKMIIIANIVYALAYFIAWFWCLMFSPELAPEMLQKAIEYLLVL